MPSVNRMRYVQRGIDSAYVDEKRKKEVDEDIATPEEIHAIIQETLKRLGASPKKVEKKPGNLMDALPEPPYELPKIPFRR